MEESSACEPPATSTKAKGRPMALGLTTQDKTIYRSNPFQPAFSFETFGMPYPFIPNFADSCSLGLFSGERGGVIFVRPTAVVDPETGDLAPLPDDLLGWLESHPNLQLSGESRVQIGGVPGREFSVKVRGRAADPPAECPECIPLFPGTDSGIFGAIGPSFATTRWTMLEVDGTPVVIAVESPPGEFKPIARDVDRLLASIRFAER